MARDILALITKRTLNYIAVKTNSCLKTVLRFVWNGANNLIPIPINVIDILLSLDSEVIKSLFYLNNIYSQHLL